MKYIFILSSLLIMNLLFVGCSSTKQPSLSKTSKEQKQEEKQNIQKENKKVLDIKKEEEVKEKIPQKEPEKKVEPKIIIKEKTKIVVIEKPVASGSKFVVGSREYVYIPSLKLTYKAKIDTGATTSSLHALDIKEFERDGQKWVKFKLKGKKDKMIDKMLPIQRIIKIKRHGAKNQKRYVVKMRINLGKASEVIELSLTDRSKFTYPVLVGRNYLNGYMIVDVSKKFMTKPVK